MFNGVTVNTRDQENAQNPRDEEPLEEGNNGEENQDDDEEEDDYEDEYDEFPLDAASVSWTGNYFRQKEGDLKFKTGYTCPLVEVRCICLS